MHIRTIMGTKKWACLKMVVFVWKAVYFLFFTFYTVTGNTNTNYPRFNCNISNISVIGFGRHIFICNYGNHLPL